jgi:hypothetical protein
MPTGINPALRGGAAAAAAAGAAPVPAAAAAVSSPIARRASPAASNGEDDEVQDVAMLAERNWTYPDLRQTLLALPAFSFVLKPDSAPAFNKYSPEEIDSLVGELMKFLLLRASARLVTPHRDVLQLLGDRAKGGAGYLLSDARRRFMLIWGWELKELDKKDAVEAPVAGHKRKSTEAGASASAGTKSYILRVPPQCARLPGVARAYNFGMLNMGVQEERKEAEGAAAAARSSSPPPSFEEAAQGLLFSILVLIYSEEHSHSAQQGAAVVGCTERKMWKWLRDLDKFIYKEQVRLVFRTVLVPLLMICSSRSFRLACPCAEES